MEYTKDMILGVHYNDVRNEVNSGKQRWTSRLWQLMKKHKWIATTVLSAIVFICIDVVLITNFLRILANL